MKMPILVEPISGNRFRALGPVAGLSAEGETVEDARNRLEQLVRERISAGAQHSWIEPIAEPQSGAHKLARHAGTWRDDPLVDEFIEVVREYRGACDSQDEP